MHIILLDLLTSWPTTYPGAELPTSTLHLEVSSPVHLKFPNFWCQWIGSFDFIIDFVCEVPAYLPSIFPNLEKLSDFLIWCIRINFAVAFDSIDCNSLLSLYVCIRICHSHNPLTFICAFICTSNKVYLWSHQVLCGQGDYARCCRVQFLAQITKRNNTQYSLWDCTYRHGRATIRIW